MFLGAGYATFIGVTEIQDSVSVVEFGFGTRAEVRDSFAEYMGSDNMFFAQLTNV